MAEWMEADYFDTFECKCGACRHTCCTGWSISVNMKDYFRLIGMDCSDALHDRLERAFRDPEIPSPDRFKMISPDWLGECPLHDSDGLCMLHRELGSACLPAICRLYPRSIRIEGGVRRACCSNSCEAVIETLMRQEQLTIVRRERDLEVGIAEEKIDLAPTFRAVDVIHDRSLPLTERIDKICAQLGAEARTDLSPAEAFRRRLSAMSALREMSKSLSAVGEEAFTRYAGADGYENFSCDIAAFERAYPEWERTFENVMMNHLLYMDFPWADSRITPQQACVGLRAAYEAMRIICAAHTRFDHSPAAIADAIAGAFHVIEHSAFYYNINILLRRA